MQVLVVYTVHLVKLFLIAELVWLFLRDTAHSNDSEGFCWCGAWLVHGQGRRNGGALRGHCSLPFERGATGAQVLLHTAVS